VIPTQGGSNNNRQTAANAAITRSQGPFANVFVAIHKVTAFCDPAGTATLTIESPPATIIWESAPGEVAQASFNIDFNAALNLPINTQADVVLTACGAGNTGHLMVQESNF